MTKKWPAIFGRGERRGKHEAEDRHSNPELATQQHASFLLQKCNPGFNFVS